MNPIIRAWLSENSPTACAIKRGIKAVTPDWLLRPVKKRYYYYLMRRGAAAMEDDARGVEELVRPGDFVIDVGAFVGFYAEFLSRLVGRSGSVWSFEPVPQTYEMLRYNMDKLGCANVRTFPLALSDHEGRALMEVPRFSSYGESYYDSRLTTSPTPGLRSVGVGVNTLDSLIGDARPAFIKIDAEGHEVPVLGGAMATLRRWHPALMLESVLKGYEEAATVLRPLGYRPYVLQGRQFRAAGTDRTQNTFFLTSLPSPRPVAPQPLRVEVPPDTRSD